MVGVGFNTYTLTVANDDLLIRETQAALQADLGGFRSLYSASSRQGVQQAVNDRLDNRTNDFLYYLKDSNNNYLAGNLATWPNKNVETVKNGVLEIQATLREDYLQNKPNKSNVQQSAIALVIEFSNGDSLIVARSVQDIEFAVALARTSSWILIIVVLIVAITSLGVAYYVVSRINKIADTADDIISTGNLSDRLYVESQWDDLSKLTLVLNQLLDKIESSVNAIRSVSDNIAHDLRTPLTRLRSHVEVIEDLDTRASLSIECDNLLSIFNSLLRISDIENSVKIAGFGTLDLQEVVNDAVDLYSPLIEAKHIQLDFSSDPVSEFTGDKDLLFQAVANVLDNAIKFTPEHGQIKVALTQLKQGARFTIDDSGDGVNQDSISKLTQRFYREDKSRTQSGNGLGLSLVNAIVKLHNGAIWFERSTIADKTGLRCSLDLKSAINQK